MSLSIRIQFTARLAMLHLLATLSVCARSQDLLVNGDFSAGNTGFTSAYVYSSDLRLEGNYFIGNNPHTYHSGAASFGDHTTGTGLMFIANASSTTANLTLWQEIIPIIANRSYVFSGWAASWGQTIGGFDQNPAVLRFMINGVKVGIDFTVASADGQWSQFTVAWDSGSSTTATLKMVDINTASSGNDFAMDDFQFRVLPPLGATITGTLQLEGIVAYASSQNITFLFRPVNGGDTISQVVFVPPTGEFSISGLPRNNYSLNIKGDKNLATNVGVDASIGNVSGVTNFLLEGDTNNDNTVDLADFGVVVNAYGGKSSDPISGYDPYGDLNGDGKVDIADFGLLVGNYETNGDP